MKKLIAIIVCLGMVVLGTVGIAIAVPITFTDTTYFNESGTDSVDYLEGLGDYVTLTQYFEFDPAAEEVLNGELTLYLVDDEFDAWNLFTWNIGGVNNDTYSYVVDGSNFINGEFSITTLMPMGGGSYTDQPLDSDCGSGRCPGPGSNPAPVPEPATVMLVGSGLLGMIAFGRKRFKNT